MNNLLTPQEEQAINNLVAVLISREHATCNDAVAFDQNIREAILKRVEKISKRTQTPDCW